MKILLVYPTQLFKDNALIEKVDKIYLIEDPFYFSQFPFHKLKLTFHRATMKYYYDYIKADKYYNHQDVDYKDIFRGATEIHLYHPIDHPILKKIHKYAKSIPVHVYDTPSFMETLEELEEYRNKYTNKKNYYHDVSFYRWQRKRLDVLMDKGKPEGGLWSYDKENRNPFDDNYEEPKIKEYHNKYIDEARRYVNKEFGDNFGENETMYYPCTFEEAERHFHNFLKKKMTLFGTFEDGVRSDIIYGPHSVLSPLLNTGLLTPKQVLKETLRRYKKKEITSYEAFIRQLIGWRSFMRFVYHYHGEEMMEMNLLGHKNKIPKTWYTGKTGIKVLDVMIEKVDKYAYLHHIERLMYVGNIALLTLMHPKEIYKWFMVCFIDSYEWVMIPNVMGMSQYSLKGISMMTRPYFSSSNYMIKMSDYEREDILDALYYHFIDKHEKILEKIYATAMQVKYWRRMDKNRKKEILTLARQYLRT